MKELNEKVGMSLDIADMPLESGYKFVLSEVYENGDALHFDPKKRILCRDELGNYLVIDFFQKVYFYHHEMEEVFIQPFQLNEVANLFYLNANELEEDSIATLGKTGSKNDIESFIAKERKLSEKNELGISCWDYLVQRNDINLLGFCAKQEKIPEDIFSSRMTYTKVDTEIFKFLIKNGASVNVKDLDINLYLFQSLFLHNRKDLLEIVLKDPGFVLVNQADPSWTWLNTINPSCQELKDLIKNSYL